MGLKQENSWQASFCFPDIFPQFGEEKDRGLNLNFKKQHDRIKVHNALFL
jgi:hypothetical protein